MYLLPSILYAFVVFIIHFLGDQQQTITLIDLAFHHGGLNCWSSLNMISAHRHVISGLSDAVSLWQNRKQYIHADMIPSTCSSLSFSVLLSFTHLFKLLTDVVLAYHHCKSAIDLNLQLIKWRVKFKLLTLHLFWPVTLPLFHSPYSAVFFMVSLKSTNVLKCNMEVNVERKCTYIRGRTNRPGTHEQDTHGINDRQTRTRLKIHRKQELNRLQNKKYRPKPWPKRYGKTKHTHT